MKYINGKRQFSSLTKADKQRIWDSLALNLTSLEIQAKHNITFVTLDKIIKERITKL